jgi:hypothetical protein
MFDLFQKKMVKDRFDDAKFVSRMTMDDYLGTKLCV